MGTTTKIAWTDKTFNPWVGCAKVSQECKFCYAESMTNRFRKEENLWGVKANRKATSESNWRQPLKWNREAGKLGIRYKVFCGSLCDVFEDKEGLNALRLKLWNLIHSTPNLDWQLLTKRPENIWGHIPVHWLRETPENVWLGTSIGHSETLEIRAKYLSLLKKNLGIKTFYSCEPLLTPINLAPHYDPDWIIIGGESGSQARKMEIEWVGSLMAQADEKGIPVFMKQLGTVLAKELGLNNKKGEDLSEWPEDWMKRQEFPK